MLPRYPIYIPSKGRSDCCLTARFLQQDGVPFYLVVEEQEVEAYERFRKYLLVLPFRDQGLITARNWIKQHSIDGGHARHWQLDDNIRRIYRRKLANRIPCAAGPDLAATEDFIDRYENVWLAGLNYKMFCDDRKRYPPFVANCHVYSCSLIDNSRPYEWRSRYNDDVDYGLQVLADGGCTMLINVFLADKLPTMQLRGGNTDDLYQGDGRLVMARSLERLWPGIVKTERRWGRPQHVINWKRFRQPLRLKPDASPGKGEYGMRLKKLREPKSPVVRKIYEEANQ